MCALNCRILLSKLLIFSLLGMTLGALLLGCDTETEFSSGLPLEVLGDVESPLSINSLSEAPDTLKLDYREQTIEVTPLEQLVLEAEPHGQEFEILFTAHDGFSVLISNDNISESYLALNKENGWEAINLNHPVSSNIKNIKEIVIVSHDLPINSQFHIIEPGRNISSLSVGELYKNGYTVIPSERGTASVDYEGEELLATSFYRRKVIDIESYVNLAGRDSIAVVGEKGEMEPLRQDGSFVLNKNSLDYMVGSEVIISRTIGIVLNPPDRVITSVYQDAKDSLDQGVPILVIMVDGLGHHQYQYASGLGYTPFLDTLPKPEIAMSAYPSVTPVNMAASLSGELPDVNGVYRRGIRQLKVPTIFAYSNEQGKSSSAVIGPIGTIELEIGPIYSVDRNEDGSTDDDKTVNALEIIADGHDFLYVHFKDVDSTGHEYGDLHENTLEAIRGNDEYIQQLVSNWQGRVLIYSDHGMYATKTGGDHGALVTESMFTPYWLFDTDK
ncbi:MAG: hypothetical protein FH749_12620 [Firmicutes bacterium]|nr:hypothetical protein [Bacillota bacterium]